MRTDRNNEQRRLNALRHYPLSERPETAFERIVGLAVHLFAVPIVLISLVEESRQWFKACYGLDLHETSREVSFCAHAILDTDVMVVHDATRDPRFAHNPLVTGEPNIRFYAGAPLRSPDGHNLGTLCLIDTSPRHDFAEEQQALLQSLAALVMDEFELRLKSRDLEQALAQQQHTEAKLRGSKRELQTILSNTSDIIASFDPALRYTYVNPPVDRYVGLPAPIFKGKTNEELGVPLHLADLWNEKLREVLKTRRYGELEFSVTTDHGPIYFQTKIVPKLEGDEVERLITVTRDVTTMKEAQQELENFFDLSQDLLLIMGLDGRVKRLNATWQKTLGFSQEELSQLSPFSLLHPDEVASNKTAFESFSRGKTLKNFEHRLRRKDGSYRYVQWNAQTLVHQGIIFGIARDVTEERLASLALQESEERFRTLFDTASLGIILTDTAGFIQRTNEAVHTLFGYNEDDLFLQPITELIPELPLEMFAFDNSPSTHNYVLELQGLRKDGSSLPLEVNLNYFRDTNRCLMVLFVTDKTSRKRQESLDSYRAEVFELIAKRTSLKTILTHLIQLLETNYPEFKTLLHVKRGQHLVLAHPSSLPSEVTQPLATLPLDGSSTTISLAAASKQPIYTDDILESELWQTVQLDQTKLRSCWSQPISSEDGNVYGTISLFSETVRQPRADELKLLGEVSHLVAIAMSQRKLLAQLEHQSFYDEVTGLGNRRLMRERLEHHLALCEQQGEALAVMLLDIDNFKIVNESYGHKTGDALLKAVATRLKTSLRPTDTVTRLGEDEFGLLLPLARDEDSSLVVKKLMEATAQPFKVGDHTFDITVSIGVSLFPDNGQSTDVLMKFADSALSVVKDEGKKTYRYYQASMMEHLSEHLELSRDLKHALASTGLVLHYQPRVHADTRTTLAAETLIRWQHPTRGFLPPAAFLGVAEKANLMTTLDAWVLRETCQQLRTWQEQNVPYTLSCNLSGDSFKDETFANKLIALLKQEGVDPKRLELEITENTLLKHPEKAANQLQKLKADLPGLRIAIDDFGTGYSSLAYLRYLPVDTLKIDRLFVRDLDHADERHRHTARAVITTIISLGHQLELNVIAEGVETETQIQILKSLGCKEIQGYAFSKPLPLEEFKKFSHAEADQELSSSNDEVTV